jgi:hypothetical protein
MIMAPQAPEFERFLRPCLFRKRHAGCDMGPSFRWESEICAKGAMYAKWITASFRGGGDKEETGTICLLRTNSLAVVTQFEIVAAPY